MKIYGIDIGLSGGISTRYNHWSMPTIDVEDKPAIYINDLCNGKKQYYKSGSKKGEVKRKLKTPAKNHKELDLFELDSIISNHSTVVIETPGISMGNAARSTATTQRNYGKILATLELKHCEIIKVAPMKWKKDLKLSKDKTQSVNMAEMLSGNSFRTARGSLIDGQAEAFLIRHWYVIEEGIDDD